MYLKWGEIQVDCYWVKTIKSQCVCFLFFICFRFWYWTKQQPPSTLRQIFSFRRPFAARLAAAPPSSSPIVWTRWWAAAGSWSWTTARCVERQHEWLRDCTIRRLNWNSFPSWYPLWFTVWIGPFEVTDWIRQCTLYSGGHVLELTFDASSEH